MRLRGLTDGHGHLGLLADAYRFVSVHEARSEDDAIAILKTDTREGWLVGSDFDQNLWREQHMPSLQKLSRAFPDRPVFVRRIDHHAAWMNEAALRALGIEKAAVLFEAEADFALAKIPRPSLQVHAANVLRAAQALREAGYTRVHDMATRTWDLAAFDAVSLPLHVHGYLYDDDWNMYDRWLNEGLPAHCVGVKIFLDGALGSRGARLKEAYNDCPNHKGHATFPFDEAQRIVTRAFKANIRVALHAIGDAAVGDAITLIERASETTGAAPALARIEHAQVIADEDLPRLKGFNVGVQFMHHHDDAPWLPARLGERVRTESRWRDLLNAGANVIGGSDFPIASFALKDALHAAQNHGTQSLTREETLAAFTHAAAKAVGITGEDFTDWNDDEERPVMSWLGAQ